MSVCGDYLGAKDENGVCGAALVARGLQESSVCLCPYQHSYPPRISGWTMKGQCVILFRNRTKEGPRFDGQIDFRAGEKSIILSQLEFRDGNRCHKKARC